MKTIFWISFLFIAYTYIGYPLILLLWSKITNKRVSKKYIERRVSLIIAAYNEEKFIGKKMENCLALDYPKDKLEIIVVSDGSDDQTNEIVKGFETKGVSLYFYERKKGKAFALNLGISNAQGEIIFFTDSRQVLERNSLRELVANFNDPSVAAVSGELILLTKENNSESAGVGLYWKVEKWMRKKQSQIHSVLGATGSIYACRRKFAKPIPPETILDDVLIPFRGILAGHRSVFDPQAKAFDYVSEDIHKEFRRKVRTLSGNHQLLILEPSLLNPLKNPVFFQFMSHKIARLLVPFAMIFLFISNFFLTSTVYLIFFGFQIGFYVSVLLSKWSTNNVLGYAMKCSNTIFIMNYAALISFFKFIWNPRNIEWQKTN